MGNKSFAIAFFKSEVFLILVVAFIFLAALAMMEPATLPGV